MRATATLRSDEAGALALRMRKHFAHKVPVETLEGAERVKIRAGEFELEPRDRELVIRAVSYDPAGLARVQEVVASHLARFVRDAGCELEWADEREAALERRAREWIAEHRLERHLLRTREWVRELRAGAG